MELMNAERKLNTLVEEVKTMREDMEKTILESRLKEYSTLLDERFSKLVAMVDPLEYFSKLVCPELVGHDDVKQAVLLMLVADRDSPLYRNRIHIFVEGVEGTGKTVLMEYLEREFGARYLSQDTTKASLKGDMRRKDRGVQVFAEENGGIICFDEIEEMADRETLRDVMENGRYKLSKGGAEEEYEAQVRIVAGTNEISKLSRPLLSRFDFVFHFDVPTEEESMEIARRITRRRAGMYESTTKLLREYVGWVLEYEPKIRKDEVEKIDAVFDEYFEQSRGKTGRWIDSVHRIARAIARLGRRDITADDIRRAIEMKKRCSYGR